MFLLLTISKLCNCETLVTYKYHKRRKSKLDRYRSRIKRIASRKKITTIEQLQVAIEEKLSIKVVYSWLYRYCVKNSIYSILKNKTQKL